MFGRVNSDIIVKFLNWHFDSPTSGAAYHMTVLNVGVIGAGYVAEAAHLPSYASNPTTEVTAIAELDPERRKTIAERYGIERRYSTGQSLIENESLDIVSICTPPATHGALVSTAADRGFNVYCEKPLAIDSETANRMKTATDRNGITASVGYLFRHYANYDRVRRMIQERIIRQISEIHTIYHTSLPHSEWFLDPDQSGGGVVMDFLPHILDFYATALETFPTIDSVQIQGTRTESVEDSARLTFSYDGATTHHVSIGWEHDREFRQETLIAQNGILEFDNEFMRGNIHNEEIRFRHGKLPRVRVGDFIKWWGPTSDDYNQRRIDEFVGSITTDGGGFTDHDVRLVEIIEEVYRVAADE